ncbi:MAG: hypothetical protein KatS3mg131_3749 [Candidatus Tectimicrobiota bacterium]|nr:MAG: hypothetical protein KatS3mg131_3749 [Candidatus Tectomicrobia bacterium]
MALTAEDRALLRQGIALLRQGDYFGAHDAWEEVWRHLRGRQRLFWQAMIQLAVGAHHCQHGNLTGCRSVWHKALAKCDALGQQYAHEVPSPLLHLTALLADCLEAVARGEDPLPRVQRFAACELDDAWLDVGEP